MSGYGKHEWVGQYLHVPTCTYLRYGKHEWVGQYRVEKHGHEARERVVEAVHVYNLKMCSAVCAFKFEFEFN